MHNLLSARSSDILERGEDHLVYDRSGHVTILKAATVWRDSDGKYYKPKSYPDTLWDLFKLWMGWI